MNKALFLRKMSDYANRGIPFLFVIDFEFQKPFLCLLSEAEKSGIYYDFQGKTNAPDAFPERTLILKNFPIERSVYKNAFSKVRHHLNHGDTFLLNLTFPTPIQCNLSLKELFHQSKAPYKMLFRDEFVVFSPEAFVKIQGNKIATFPMKGTIDAKIPDAENHLLADKKEEWEHNTIVDLMRNDLSIIATDVRVAKYRYAEKIKTDKGEVLQTSSEITGNLADNWREHFGDILSKLLPAGSVSGAPKEKTLAIIRDVENGDRGYYSGIFGIFDGRDLDTAVAIRFIEKKEQSLFFRSGGGITANSDCNKEYRELIQKIYVPTF